MFTAEVKVALKPIVSDPQGLAVKHALENLGVSGIEDVRMGKIVKITLDAESKEKAVSTVEDMCRKLLANPIIEDYSFEVAEQDDNRGIKK